MGKALGIFQFSGTVGGVTVDKNGNVRQKVASNKASFSGKASMQRVRENAGEFGAAASAGKAVREALRSQIQNAKDSLATSRLTQTMKAIINLDTVGARGYRQVLADNCGQLLGFNFNQGAGLGQSLYSPFTISAAGSAITLDISRLDPNIDISYPTGATHFEVVFGAVSVDFAAKTYREAVVALPLGILALGSAAKTNISQVATLPAAPSATELVLGVLGMNYYQQVNGKFYPLNNNANNPLAVVYTSATGSGGGTPVTYSVSINGPSNTAASTTLTASAGDKFEFDELTTGSSGPYTMDINVGGTQVGSVSTFDRYAGKPFRFTHAGVAHTGAFAATVNF